jgi:hypothetical protein
MSRSMTPPNAGVRPALGKSPRRLIRGGAARLAALFIGRSACRTRRALASSSAGRSGSGIPTAPDETQSQEIRLSRAGDRTITMSWFGTRVWIRSFVQQVANSEQGIFLAEVPVQPALIDFSNFLNQAMHLPESVLVFPRREPKQDQSPWPARADRSICLVLQSCRSVSGCRRPQLRVNYIVK